MTTETTPLTSSSPTTPSTGRKTFGQMVSDVAATFGLDGDSEKEAQIGRRIHNIIDELNMKRLWQFNLIKAADITTVSGTANYSVPSDFWKAYNTRKSDGLDYTLDGISRSNKDIIFSSQNGITGYPFVRVDFNVFRDGTFELFPTPDGAYTIVLRYFRLIAKPSAAGEYFDMPPPYQVVPEYGACAHAAALVGSNMVSYWDKKYDNAVELMEKSDEDQIGDEQLRFVSIEEIAARGYSYMSPSARPRFLDMWGLVMPLIGTALSLVSGWTGTI